jgi:hypothetical protein
MVDVVLVGRRFVIAVAFILLCSSNSSYVAQKPKRRSR